MQNSNLKTEQRKRSELIKKYFTRMNLRNKRNTKKRLTKAC